MYQRFGLVSVRVSATCLLPRIYVPMPSTSVTAIRITWSASRQNTADSAANKNTIAVVMPVSLRDGQVTLLVSCRTSCMNLNGLSFAMISLPRALTIPHRNLPPNEKDDAGQILLGNVRRGCPETGPPSDECF